MAPNTVLLRMKRIALVFAMSLLARRGRSSFATLRVGRKSLTVSSSSLASSEHWEASSEPSVNEDSNNKKTRNHQIRWTTPKGNDIVFEAQHGETLRTAALRRKRVSPHNGRARLINCRGLGTCGTCAVEITPQSSLEPMQRSRMEQARLNFPPHSVNRRARANEEQEQEESLLRLACQVQIRGDVRVTKRTGFWGQSTEMVQPSDAATTYFGELEFVLDNKSPPEKEA